jgi:integrase
MVDGSPRLVRPIRHKLGDLVLGTEQQRITFRDTKNGDDVVAELHPACRPVLERYLEWRGGLHRRDEPLFLAPRYVRRDDGSYRIERMPYSDRGRRGGWSGQNKAAFNGMKRRAIRARRKIGADEARERRAAHDRAGAWETIRSARADGELLAKVTQHWLRHWFATHSLALGAPKASVMEQGGWRDARSLERYEHDVADVRRRMVAALPIGGSSLTRPAPESGNPNKDKALKS